MTEPTSLAQALTQATQTLKAAGIENPRSEARHLACHLLDLDQATLILRDRDPFDPSDLNSLVARRAAHEPLAYITGQKSFWKHDFLVTKDTLIPRPETELLVEQAIARNPSRILDLGTGTGCILLSILTDCPDAKGIGADISKGALEIAQQNAERLGVANRIQFIRSDWFANIAGKFDTILSNPPYVASSDYQTLDPTIRQYEPRSALIPIRNSPYGLEAYRTIAAQAPKHLSESGSLILEIGADQGRAVASLLTDAGFQAVEILPDLSGQDRCVVGRWVEALTA